MEKIPVKLIRLFYLLFAICFTYVAVNIIFRNPLCGTANLVITTVCVLALLFLINILLDRCSSILEKRYKLILGIFLAVMFIIELIAGISLRSDFIFDIGNINKGAWEWVETGTFKNFYYYYYFCPNNLAPMAFWYIFLKAASLVRITDYYAVTVTVLCLMLSGTMALVSLICKKLSGIRSAVFALILFALSAPFYVMGAAVYTDAMTMLFPVLIFYLYLLSKEKERLKDRIILYVIMGLVCAVGSMLKFTVFIMAIAVLIDMLLNKKTRKDSWKAGLCFVLITVLLMSSFNTYIYARHLDKDEAYRVNKPYSFWVMMGFGGDGRYNQRDADLIADTAPEERQEKAIEETKKRIADLGLSGTFKLFTTKSIIDLGDGTYGISDTFNYTPLNETWLRDWVVDKSAHFGIYETYSTAVHISMILIMLFLAWLFVFKRKEFLSGQILPIYLSVFGLWFFLLFWESNKRYFSNFVPLIFICAAVGIQAFIKSKSNTSHNVNSDTETIIENTDEADKIRD